MNPDRVRARLACRRHDLAGQRRRSRSRALCNCDFDVPSEMPSSDAISRCSQPSTSCSTNTVRQPGGSDASARSRSTPIDDAEHRARADAVARAGSSSSVSVICAEPRATAPQVIEAQIRRQPEQPRAERRLALVEPELAVRGQEDLLQQILGVGAADQAARQPEEPRRVRAIQLFESARRTRLAPLHEGQVGMPAHVIHCV